MGGNSTVATATANTLSAPAESRACAQGGSRSAGGDHIVHQQHAAALYEVRVLHAERTRPHWPGAVQRAVLPAGSSGGQDQAPLFPAEGPVPLPAAAPCVPVHCTRVCGWTPVPARCSHSRAGHLPPAEAPVPRPSSGPRCQRQALPAPRPAPPPSMVQPDTLPAGWPAARSPHIGTVPLRAQAAQIMLRCVQPDAGLPAQPGPLLPHSPGRSLCCPAPHCRRGTDADKAAAVPRAVPGAGAL